MLELCREAYQILKEVDPTITVVSPSATGDWGSSPGVRWLDDFLSQGGGDYADVIGYHFYVMPGPPENIVPLIQKVKAVMAKYGQNDKPLWNTECGWLGDEAFSSEDKAAGYVARSYVLNWADGVDASVLVFLGFAFGITDLLNPLGSRNLDTGWGCLC